MTRKDYKRAVECLAMKAGTLNAFTDGLAAFVMFFEGDNPRFDVQRFTDAAYAAWRREEG